VALFAFLWAASWQGQLIYPVTVQQAAQWAPRSEAAARAVAGAPHRARTVEVVVSRFSGNLSWVPAIASLVGATKVTIYCKVRVPRACVWEPRLRVGAPIESKRPCWARAVHPGAAQRGQRGPHILVAPVGALGCAA